MDNIFWAILGILGITAIYIVFSRPIAVEFKCPRCNGTAFYYPDILQALCGKDGLLLYTEVPREIRNSPNLIAMIKSKIEKCLARKS